MKLCRFVIIISLTIAIGMFFPVYSVFLRNKPERSSSLMNSLTQSNINKNKRNVEVDDSKEFGMKLLKLLKKSVISVNPDDPSTDDYNRPKKISSPHTKDEDEPTIAHSNNTISATNSSPTPSEYLSDPDAQQIQEEEATLQKIIVVLCSLGASLILVTIAIGILFWKVQKQRKFNQKSAADNVPTNSNNQNEKDKDGDKDIDDGRDEPDDRPNIDVTVSINNENDDNDNLNGTAYNKSTSFKTEFPHVIEESSLDTKKLEMSRSAVPSYPSYPSNQSLSILPSAPTVEELELHDASASNFSTDPPAYSSLLNPSAPPLYDAPILYYTDSNNYIASIVRTPILPSLNTQLNIVSDAPMTPEETNSPLSSTALTFPTNAINAINDDDDNDSGPTHSTHSTHPTHPTHPTHKNRSTM
ncbi:hypothetical protein C2G38_2049236 [Gigaspora rosea]|uniref:Uncharacterized protein n=1 Tax=Gigaspora rosea TaxID=44941 RepID=A0A397U8N7_9GLOM|nr:hypothetical protein C2G38_2049236 [Gigaspora rosea]